MGVNIRTKGASGEREIAKLLTDHMVDVLTTLGATDSELILARSQVQRNQNQTAVGGCDLVGTLHLAIEVKRQEALSLNTWWKQAVTSASNLGDTYVPVLIYRASRQPWRVRTVSRLHVMGVDGVNAVSDISIDAFVMWWRALVENAYRPKQSNLGVAI